MDLERKKIVGRKMFMNGRSIIKISGLLDISRVTLSKYLKSMGNEVIHNKRKFEFNESIFEHIDSEEKAYWFGFIFADGSVYERKSKDGGDKGKVFELTLKSSDRKHISKFVKFLGLDDFIIKDKTVYLKGEQYKACRIMICSTLFCDKLILNNLLPRKSLIKTFPSLNIIPEVYQKDFMRGYFDGNGHISNISDFPRIVLTSTAEVIDGFFRVLIINNPLITKVKYQKAGEVFSLHKSRIQALMILDFLYDNSPADYLDSKYSTYCRLKGM